MFRALPKRYRRCTGTGASARGPASARHESGQVDWPWTEVPVLFQGFTLQPDRSPNTAPVLRLAGRGRGRELAPVLDQIPHLKQRTTEPLQETRTLEQELPRAADTWSRTQQFVEKLIRGIEQHNDLELASARPLIRPADSVKANASAMFWMA